MENTNEEKEVDLEETTTEDELEEKDENEDDDLEDDEKEDDKSKDKSDEIKKLEAEVAKYKRMAKRAKKVASKDTVTKSDPSDFTEGQTALLIAKGIEADAEVELVKQVMEDSGKSMMEVLKLGYFKSELDTLRKDTKNQDAIPKGTKRSSSTAKDKLSYWMNKDIKDVPPELRREVVNAKLEQESKKSIFTDNPVAGDSI